MNHISRMPLLPALLMLIAGTLHAQTPLRLIHPNGNEHLASGHLATIQWTGGSIRTPVRLEYSTNNGEQWDLIADVVSAPSLGQTYTWMVPSTPSKEVIVRVSQIELPTPRIIDAHSAFINSSRLSPDNSVFVTNSDDNTTVIWQTGTGVRLHTLTGHTGDVLWSAFSPNGQELATAGGDGTVMLWNVATGAFNRSIAAHTGIVAYVAYSHDGERLATAGEDDVAKIWDVATGRLLHTLSGHTHDVNSVEFSPDGIHLVTASRDSLVKVWDTSGTLVHTLPAFTGEVHHAMYSPDGSRIITGGSDPVARIWQTATYTLLQRITDPGAWWILKTSYSDDGSRITTTGLDGTARIWESATGKLVRTLEGHSGNVGSAHFSADNSFVLTSANDGSARIWPISSKRVQDMSDRSVTIYDEDIRLVYPNGGEVLAAGSYATIRWEGVTTTRKVDIEYSIDDGESWMPIAHQVQGPAYLWGVLPTPDPRCIARITSAEAIVLTGHFPPGSIGSYSRDGSLAVGVTSDRITRVWDGITGQQRLAHMADTTVYWSTLSPDGQRIATAYGDGSVRIWSIADGELLRTIAAHSGAVTYTTYSPDGSRIATSGNDGTARIRDAASGNLLHTLTGHTGRVVSVEFSPDQSQLVTAGTDRSVRIWTSDGAYLSTLPMHPDQVTHALYSPDGRWILTTCRDLTTRLFDAASGALAHTFIGKSGGITPGAFNADGTIVMTAGSDGMIRLWNTTTGKLQRTIAAHSGGVLAASITRDGRRVLSVGNDYAGRIWTLRDSASGGVDYSDATWAITWDPSSVTVDNAVTGADAITLIPNPASSGVKINCILEKSGAVRFDLVDGRGTTVRSIAREYMAAGEHSIDLDLQGLASGPYHCVVTTAEGVRTTRLHIVR